MRVRTENLGVAGPATPARAYRVVDDRVYVVTRNIEPPMLGAYDLADGTIAGWVELPADASSWAVDALDDSLYLGPEGDLYRAPAPLESVDRVCGFPEDRVVCDIDTHGDRIFVGTYPTASLYEYDAGTGTVRELASELAGERYVRNVRATDETIYAGSAPNIGLFAIDRATGEREEILPDELSDQSSTRTLMVTDDAVVLITRPAFDMLVVDRDDHEEYRIARPEGCDRVTNLGVRDGSVFVAATASGDSRDEGGALFRYDVATDEFTRLGDLPHSALDNGLFFWENRVVGCESTGEIWTHDPASGESTVTDLGDAGLPAGAEVPQSFGLYHDVPVVGAHRKLHVHNPDAPEPRQVPSSKSAKAMTAVEGSLYTAMYVDAVIGRWSPGDEEVTEVATIGEAQNRPRAIHYHEPTGTVYVGTVPEYGHLGGALVAYDPADGTVSVHRHVVEDQSICALASTTETVFLGSDVHGEKVDPVASEARLAAWDPVDRVKRWETTPAPDAEAITDLVTFDGEVWGTTDGSALFSIDPETLETAYPERIADPEAFQPRCRQLVAGAERLYCTTEERLVAIDPSSRDTTVLLEGHEPAVPELAIDDSGTLYTFAGRDLLAVRRPFRRCDADPDEGWDLSPRNGP